MESARTAGRDVEIIIVDDASTEETSEVCRNLTDVKCLHLVRHQGLGGARNVGLVASQSEYVTFLDDDDIRLPDTLDQQAEILDRNPEAGLVYGQALLGTERVKPSSDRYPLECYQGDVFFRVLTRNFIPCGSVLFRRSCLTRVGMLADNTLEIEDWDLWVRIAELYPILAVETPVIIWRKSQPDSGQLTSHADLIVSRCVRQFRNWTKLPRLQGASPATRQNLWRDFCENMGEHLIWESLRALRHGNVSQSLKNLSVGMQLHPLTLGRLIRHRVFKVPRPRNQETDAFGIQSRAA